MLPRAWASFSSQGEGSIYSADPRRVWKPHSAWIPAPVDHWHAGHTGQVVFELIEWELSLISAAWQRIHSAGPLPRHEWDFNMGSSAAVGGELPQVWVVTWLDVLWRIGRVLDSPDLEMWECELGPAGERELRAKDALFWGAEADLSALVYWEWFCGLESSNWPVVCGIPVLCHVISAVPPPPLMPQGAVGGFGSWTFLLVCLGYTALFQRFHASLVCERECTYIYIPSWGTLKTIHLETRCPCLSWHLVKYQPRRKR